MYYVSLSVYPSMSVYPSLFVYVCLSIYILEEAHRVRKVEVVINHLRCRPTNLTHNYLMNSEVPEPAPGCPLCGDATLIVKHIMLQC